MTFDGFIRVYKEGRDEGPDEDAEKTLPALTAEQVLRMLGNTSSGWNAALPRSESVIR